ncbi:MAG: cytidylate kinase-like family protein [Eubacterium sp.]|nr:cytidylate kinase-like family protein [Eubacterium sp.]
MKKQVIVTFSREYASGGHVIAEMLAEKLGISFYDRNLLDEIASEKLGNVDKLRRFDEMPRPFFSMTVRGMASSPEENVAQIQFDYIRKMADAGESFVIVGRCAEEVLSGYPCLVKIFVTADEQRKIARVCNERNVNVDEARGIMLRHDKNRKAYHNYYCSTKWGDSRGYDLCINASRLGFEGTTDFIENYIRKRFNE